MMGAVRGRSILKDKIMSRNKLEGRYKTYKYGKHSRSLKKLMIAISQAYGNPFYTGKPKVLK